MSAHCNGAGHVGWGLCVSELVLLDEVHGIAMEETDREIEVVLADISSMRGRLVRREDELIRQRAERKGELARVAEARTEVKVEFKSHWLAKRDARIAALKVKRTERRTRNQAEWRAKHNAQLNRTRALLFKALRLLRHNEFALPADLAAVLSQHESGRSRGRGGRRVHDLEAPKH